MSCQNCGTDVVTNTCGNPCATSAVNTAACENIASQIENFTTSFFGVVTKTELDGVVSWSLPCNLEIGLDNNPRMDGEGLACYFLRLFNDGILGATGPAGDAGAPGADGFNAFTVTLASFTQPSLASPSVQLVTSYNPSILPGTYVFVQASGWYLVDAVDTNGNVWATLQKAVVGAPSTIVAGKLVIPSGYPGESIAGPQGVQGPVGPQGIPGQSFTTANEFYYATVGTDYSIQLLYASVNFVNSSPEVTLGQAGTYLLTAVVSVVADPAIALTDEIFCKLQDATAVVDVPGSEQSVRGLNANSIAQINISVRFDAPANGTTVRLFAKMDTKDLARIRALHTTLTAVRLE